MANAGQCGENTIFDLMNDKKIISAFFTKIPRKDVPRGSLTTGRQPSFDDGGHDTEKKLPLDMT